MKGKSESEVINIILEEFLSQPHIQDTFSLISDRKYTGCEKWFQIEFLKFLVTHSKVNEEQREELFDFDKRKEKEKHSGRIDLTFRAKHKHYYTSLELKHKNYLAKEDIRNDLKKASTILPSQRGYFRRSFSLLIHPFKDEIQIKKSIAGCELQNKFEFTTRVPASNISCTVFSVRVI